MGLCERKKSPSPLHGAPRWNAPTPGSLTPCGVRSPGATRPSSLRDSDLAMQTRFRDTYKVQSMACALQGSHKPLGRTAQRRA